MSGFDSTRFAGTHFADRTEGVPVPALVDFFSEGEDPVFIVRGLNSEELQKATNRADSLQAYRKLLEKIGSQNPELKASAIAEMLGYGEDVPRQVVLRKFQLMFGSVDPVIDEEMAVKIADAFPIEFIVLTDKIVELSGRGKLPPGKS